MISAPMVYVYLLFRLLIALSCADKFQSQQAMGTGRSQTKGAGCRTGIKAMRTAGALN